MKWKEKWLRREFDTVFARCELYSDAGIKTPIEIRAVPDPRSCIGYQIFREEEPVGEIEFDLESLKAKAEALIEPGSFRTS